MKVLLVNTNDFGGAANACIRLHLALLERGCDVTLLTLSKTRNDLPNHHSYFEVLKKDNSLVTKIGNRLKSKLGGGDERFNLLKKEASKSTDYFSSITTQYRIDQIEHFEEYDIINLHWVANFLDWASFFSSSSVKNVVWSMHDMAPFTGGYHYSSGYTGYQSLDETPPFLKHTSNPNFASEQLKHKIQILQDSKVNLTIVPLSTWLMNCSKSSTLFKELPHKLIPNSVDTKIFKPLDRKACREILNLPQDKKIILFVSESIDNKRKGFEFLSEALKQMGNEYLLCGIGHNSGNTAHIHHLGVIKDERVMAIAYNAADLFVLPAKEDNLPNVVVESLCCGTPVVGFSIGGMIDMVETGRNGLLSETISADSLMESMNKFFHEGVEDDRKAISAEAHEKYAFDVQANAFMKLFEEIKISGK